MTNALKNSMDFDKQKSDLAANLNEQKQFPNQHKMDSMYLILNSEVFVVFTCDSQPQIQNCRLNNSKPLRQN